MSPTVGDRTRPATASQDVDGHELEDTASSAWSGAASPDEDLGTDLIQFDDEWPDHFGAARLGIP